MKTTYFEGCNIKMGPPEGWTDEQCNTIDACQFHDEATGTDFVIVAFVPTEADIENQKAGWPIYLKIYGKGMPPVALYTADENGRPVL